MYKSGPFGAVNNSAWVKLNGIHYTPLCLMTVSAGRYITFHVKPSLVQTCWWQSCMSEEIFFHIIAVFAHATAILSHTARRPLRAGYCSGLRTKIPLAAYCCGRNFNLHPLKQTQGTSQITRVVKCFMKQQWRNNFVSFYNIKTVVLS